MLQMHLCYKTKIREGKTPKYICCIEGMGIIGDSFLSFLYFLISYSEYVLTFFKGSIVDT